MSCNTNSNKTENVKTSYEIYYKELQGISQSGGEHRPVLVIIFPDQTGHP